jgi:S-adenosylmethionine decarboxylase
MTDAPRLREDSLALVRQFGLHAVGTHFHSFTPTEPGQGSGVTGVVLLAESHVAMHTWPESGRVSIDVFVCNVSVDHSQGAQALLDALIEGFRPDLVRRQALQRG